MEEITIKRIPETEFVEVFIDGKEVDGINSLNICGTHTGVYVNIEKATLKERRTISGLISEV